MVRRLIIISTLALAVAIPVFAQGRLPRIGQGGQGQSGDRIIQRFDRALDLTPEQETQLRGILDSRRQETQSLAQEMKSKAQDLKNLMQQTSPNPADVGNAALAVKALRQRMQSIRQGFQSEFKAILRSDQVSKYENLLNAGNGRPGFLGRRFRNR